MIISHLEFTLLKDDLNTNSLASEILNQTFDVCSRIIMKPIYLDDYSFQEQKYLKEITKHTIYMFLLVEFAHRQKPDLKIPDVITYIFEDMQFNEDFHQEFLSNSNELVKLSKGISNETKADLYSIAQIAVALEAMKHFILPLNELKEKLVPNIISEELFNYLKKDL